MDENETTAPENAVTLDLLATVAPPEEDLVESPEAFLTYVSARLKASDDSDADMAVVLSDHLLTVTSHANVVVNAKAAI